MTCSKHRKQFSDIDDFLIPKNNVSSVVLGLVPIALLTSRLVILLCTYSPNTWHVTRLLFFSVSIITTPCRSMCWLRWFDPYRTERRHESRKSVTVTHDFVSTMLGHTRPLYPPYFDYTHSVNTNTVNEFYLYLSRGTKFRNLLVK